ncbi:ribokinase [Roseobacter sp. HKCCD9010]|uniref:ribokinase n=1 Tax=unclassified Roseobacter TaxID=196798 RepID=UPI001492A1E2|nr:MULTISPECIES: ribokinase [unclassified Roseobacter]MBF9048429.1 ribokinase [Rhodobacterales bacterium HKCCD4356]NNV10428.1 ribokinase [Roseobacter sp. HKCCD7357]NNV14613.1 ribokinase [Roseobacter sp. HKCCD8768]NNV24072.1 ribokinase [Roseobacter sp. HKCCD8192]NNV28329.1 ribokinase [Roseobacter sp. HKCCD9061]
MAILCIGSINIDHVYHVPHIPAPGETLAATGYAKGLGGKGANQSIAAAKAGASVSHCGLIGDEGQFLLQQMRGAGVDVGAVTEGPMPTGHAIISVDPTGENAITIFQGANGALKHDLIAKALGPMQSGDWLMLQNEVNLTAQAARLGKAAGMKVAYSAAPFDVSAVEAVLPFVDLLLMNEIEAAQLAEALGDVVGPEKIITMGAKGARWHHPDGEIVTPGYPVAEVVDTTGAGDCFAGFIVASLDQGLTREQAMDRASAAAAIQVTRPGAADAMPEAVEVTQFLTDRAG